MPPEQHRYTTEQDSGESASSLSLSFDKLSIPEELYESNPEEARKKILERLQKDQDVLKGRLTKEGVSEGIIEDIYESSKRFAMSAMRADQLIRKHPKSQDDAKDAFYRAQGINLEKRGKLIEKAQKPYTSSYGLNNFEEIDKKIESINEGIYSYSERVEQSFAFKLAPSQDLNFMMNRRKNDTNFSAATLAHFPNILKSIYAKETPHKSPSPTTEDSPYTGIKRRAPTSTFEPALKKNKN
jgi:hypothetical protein